MLSVVAGAAILSSAPRATFPKTDKAHYKDQATLDFVLPGLVVTINSASIASNGTIQTNFTLTDPSGLVLDRLGVNTPGAVSVSFVIGAIPQGAAKVGSGQYISYITHQVTATAGAACPASICVGGTATQPTSDSGGTYVANADGSYTYTFGNKAPTGFDPTITTTIGIYASRNLSAFGLATYYGDALFNFVPNGSKVTVVRDVVDTTACNQCHDPLALHGGSRQLTGLCIICHQPQNTDPNTGNLLDFKVMIHKLHDGAYLPSVVAGGKYEIIGYMNSISDFSTIVFPDDVTNQTTTPNGVRDCAKCHTSAASQSGQYMTNPTRVACGSCHDDVNFATGVNHPGGPQFDDNECSTCHIPKGEMEFDASIAGAHTIPTLSTQLPGTTFALQKVTNGVAGKSPTVTFLLTNKAGAAIPPSSMASLSLVITGPTTDYPSSTSESATGATCSASGVCTYTFKYVIPSTATGTYTIGIEGYANITLDAGTTIAQTVRDDGLNQVINFSVDGSPVTPRRTVVELANCNVCHNNLALHGGLRNNVTYCPVCHNPNGTDSSERPVTAGPAQGINFALLVHKIHTGTNLTQNFTVYGYMGSVNNFNGVLFPGNLANCDKCHATGSNELPIAAVLPVVNPQGFISPAGPTTSACTACHDPEATSSHALANTTILGESCVVCHGPDAQFSVDSVHTIEIPAASPNQ
ncbi:MAG TPA: OmcA/MtrC family decaheme c-type cytochrome [Bryobacteraceae bacterium]|nr:OmcA/MtrC family decaheme c-type cytochrome [Bryobacteraceae bacterium]